jgi:hypothetical protein
MTASRNRGTERKPGEATGVTTWAEVHPDMRDYVLAGLDMEQESRINSDAVREAYLLAAAALRKVRP